MKMPIILTFILSIFFVFNSHSKVIAPNYNFNLNQLEDFYPNKKLSALVSKYGPPEKMGDNKYKFMVRDMHYVFPVIVKSKDDNINDFYSPLPSYFLHDVFHQSLINRYGKQTEYHNKNGHALYIWKNVKGFDFYYTGTCTITCFPIYFAGALSDRNKLEKTIFEEISGY